MSASTADRIANRSSRTGSSVVVFSLRVIAPEGKRGDILGSLRSLVGPATAEKACLACRVFQEADDPDAITFVEAWATRSDLERHVRSHQHRHLLSVLDLSKTVPEIRLDEVGAVDAGIDVLASMASDHRTNPRNNQGGMK